MLTLEEKRNKQKGAITTVIVHLLLLIFFLLYKAWPFDPPLAPQFGIEVQFGTSDVGSGDVQNESKAGENTEESEETSESESENVEESQTETTESTESVEQTEVTEALEAVEESSEVIESEIESLENTTNTKTTTGKVTEKVTEKTEVVKTETKEEVVNENNMMGSNSSNNNNGDDANEVGDKGVENGSVNSDNLMGIQGGGNGASLNMNGWQWDNLPKKKDSSTETGKITFKITIDEDGIIESVIVVNSTVSIPVQNFYRDLLFKEATLKKASNFNGSSSSTGIVEWYIKSR